MNKLALAVALFLLVGSLMAYQQSRETGESFPRTLINWLFHLGSNVKSVTGYAVQRYTWLPNSTERDT
jgi:hypothetical protein